MDIAVIGISHRTATVKIREKVSFSESKKIEILNRLLDQQIKEAVIVSTCNRSEIYIADEFVKSQIQLIKDLYQEFLQTEDLDTCLVVKTGEEAIRHLYYVAAGLDSLVLGEDQILGQVKVAHQMAMDVGASGKILNKLFREAITTGKQIKNEIKISEYPISVSYVGIKYLKEKMGTLKDKNVLLVGMGKMNQLALKYLEEEAIKAIYIANRNLQKLAYLEEEYANITLIPYEKRYNVLEMVDCVITSTSAPHSVFKLEQMPELAHKVYMMDMAVPRDVAEDVKDAAFIELYNMDDFEQICDDNLEKRKQLAKEAETRINEHVELFLNWMNTIGVDLAIQSLNERCYQIQHDTMHCISNKVALSCKDKSFIEKMIASSLKRLIREPIQHLKEIDDVNKQLEYKKMMQELFGLEDV